LRASSWPDCRPITWAVTIKSNNLQNPENRREIMADDKLREIFGKDSVSMFEMNKHIARHLK
jgi:chromatin remodeling complex protein RSC6